MELGEVELLVNNAGIATAEGFASASVDREIGEIILNIDVVVELTHAALQGMVRSGRGGVINLGCGLSALSSLRRLCGYKGLRIVVFWGSRRGAKRNGGARSRALPRFSRHRNGCLQSQRGTPRKIAEPHCETGRANGTASAGARTCC